MARRQKATKKAKYIVGIDEVGRGPLAGPVAVGAVCVPVGKMARIRRAFAGVRDSKKLSPESREAWAKLIREESAAGNLTYCVCYVSNSQIDKKGIAVVIRLLVARCLARLGVKPEETEVLLDGSLRAPAEFVRQKTIIRGDDTVLQISMASVIAKVSRDRRMRIYARIYAGYGFEVHKGYGTRAHMQAIKRLGLSPVHRTSFCGFYTAQLERRASK